MYSNIGGKIKGLAIAAMVLGAIGFIISGLALIQTDLLAGILIIISGILGSWLASLVLYGFGELIEKVCDIAEQMVDDDEE